MQKLSENISIILGASSLLLLITLFIVMLVMAYLKRDLKHLKEKESMEEDFEKQLLQSQLETQEETLNQLGNELHDNIGQLLNSTKLLIGVAQRSIPHPPDTLVTADETLAKAIQELRSLSKSLNKEWLEQFNFIQNIEAEITRINSARSLHIYLSAPGALTMKPDKQIILFRIVQETLQNSIKHAGAKNIYIRIKEDTALLNITITDDGSGFEETGLLNGVGILNIRHRTHLLGGTVQWQSALNKGTIVLIQIPVNFPEHEDIHRHN
jgi:signal transduction histidine kinase